MKTRFILYLYNHLYTILFRKNMMLNQKIHDFEQHIKQRYGSNTFFLYIFIFAKNARKFMRKLHENTFPPVPFPQFTIVNFRNFNDNIISFQKIHNFEHHGDKRYGANAFFSGRPQRGPGKPQSEQPSSSLF